MRKEDLLPTLHFSGLRSLHCIKKKSCLLCISLVEGTTDALVEARIASINVINGRQGESCDSLFKLNGQSCVSSKLSVLNQSEMVELGLETRKRICTMKTKGYFQGPPLMLPQQYATSTPNRIQTVALCYCWLSNL
ncbi:hypothetical protein LOK49_LG08G01839 [Camellia lanceoleosa]|uniref:Uncharacterized protein n=1 Tax=Camellia lanceoleosa TaxID=1840588 RepID=A0ACC0GTM5_9ERIC|nr:hypothetical protein LOK49_LG08G01839 [Camellia lanceoleosa]